MKLNYYTSSSGTEPDLIDNSSSKKVTYLRRNVTLEEQEDGSIIYTYEECKLPKADYENYINEQLLQEVEESRGKVSALENEITELEMALCEVYELVALAVNNINI